MTTRKRKHRLTISQRDHSLPIPLDLVLEIFSRLPVKSVAICRCVSKQWGSILSRQDFTELFLTRSTTLPKLLFSCKNNSKLFLFSSPHVQDSSVRVSGHHIPFAYNSNMYGSVNGLVCATYPRFLKEEEETVPLICNPSTGQSLTSLPKVKTKKTMIRLLEVGGFFGYDPIGKQFKVLSMTRAGKRCYGYGRAFKEHQVLTLGTKKPSWRMVGCRIEHYPLSRGVCINGVLYYAAGLNKSLSSPVIICFDVRYEKFSFIKRGEKMIFSNRSVLVNYKGKLGALLSNGLDRLITGETTSFEMRILEDAEKHEWLKHVYEFPYMWKDAVGEAKLYFVGVVACTNEIMLAPCYITDPFYVFYYNIETKTIRRVEIQGLDTFKDGLVYTSVDHLEDVKLMEMFRT